MLIFIASFLAGIVTVLSPCVLPVLPVIIGGSLADRSPLRPLIITGSLGVSIIAFTLLLKASTLLINIPQSTWSYLSGGIIFFFGLAFIFPNLWSKLSLAIGFSSSSERALQSASMKKGIWGNILLGASLGPVFASCSPIYFIVLANVLPLSFAKGLIALIFYGAGLAFILFIIAIFGQRAIAKVRWAANPYGWFRKSLGILFIVLALAIMSGYDKRAEVWLLENGINPGGKVEEILIDSFGLVEDDSKKAKTESMSEKVKYPKAPDFKGLQNWINSEPINSITDLQGKVVLIDFWTYSCINCIRTLPFIQAWHEKYEDDGLVIVGVHAPEFQFEKILANVQKAAKQYGLTYPIVQDNDFKTWRNYDNHYWPAKYLIDRTGHIRYTHFGEGKYDETEKIIRELLEESGQKVTDDMTDIIPEKGKAQSPETYFGSKRNKLLGNGEPRTRLDTNFTRPDNIEANTLYLEGDWKIEEEFSQATSAGSKIIYKFKGKKVFLVARSDQPVGVNVYIEGLLTKTLTIQADQLYTFFEDDTVEERLLEIEVLEPGFQAFAFTFG